MLGMLPMFTVTSHLIVTLHWRLLSFMVTAVGFIRHGIGFEIIRAVRHSGGHGAAFGAD